jgi:hypothetical protein
MYSLLHPAATSQIPNLDTCLCMTDESLRRPRKARLLTLPHFGDAVGHRVGLDRSLRQFKDYPHSSLANV